MSRHAARILVVDGDASCRKLLQVVLEGGDNHEVIAVRSAESALQEIADGPVFELVLADIQLPGASGVELVTRIRAAGNDVPIMMLSSSHAHKALSQAFEAGADDYLEKPIDINELRSCVADLLAKCDQPKLNAGISASSSQLISVQYGDAAFIELTAATQSGEIDRFQRFADRLAGTTLSEKERYDFRLALEELLRNAVEWGNQNDASKQLKLAYCLMPDRITVRIEDEGAGFDPLALPDPTLDPRAHIQNRLLAGKRIGGWGVFLARKLVDEVTFNKKGNTVFLTKYLKKTAPRPSRRPLLKRRSEQMSQRPPENQEKTALRRPRPSTRGQG